RNAGTSGDRPRSTPHPNTAAPPPTRRLRPDSGSWSAPPDFTLTLAGTAGGVGTPTANDGIDVLRPRPAAIKDKFGADQHHAPTAVPALHDTHRHHRNCTPDPTRHRR